MEDNNGKTYKLTISGGGIQVDKDIPEDLAHKILVLLVPTNFETTSSTKIMDAGENVVLGEGSPKEFMLQKKPSTDMEKITCLAYYLVYNRNIPEFKTEELTDLNREAQQRRFANPSAAARNAVQFGYLELAGGGKKQITTDGEDIVKALPNREAVKRLQENMHRSRARRVKGGGKSEKK